ncbi:MAG: ABC transporter permease [Clostridiales bacterium]|nr:ABC transporter permease [Clostridiales bacterium]
MTKMLAFCTRNIKEMLRDKTNLLFGIGFPVIVLLLLQAIQSNIPVEMFEINKLTPGIAVFGLSFISLFSGVLIAKDRSSSFMLRLFASPMKSSDFIYGYTLPLIPMSLAQVLICFLVAMIFKLTITINLLLAIAVLLPVMIVFIAIGLICGSLLNDKQVGGICGALLTNLTAWLSDTWFDISLVGGWFETVANALPFVHAVRASRTALSGNYGDICPDLWWTVGYAVVLTGLAIFIFTRKMNTD